MDTTCGDNWDLAEHAEIDHLDNQSIHNSEDVKTLHDMRQVALHGTSTQLQELYNALSDSYDEHCEKLGKETGARNLAKIVESTQPNKEARILDVGCGNGLFGKQPYGGRFHDVSDGLYDGSLRSVIAHSDSNDESGDLVNKLSDSGYTNIDGLDFAQNMLDLCKSRDLYSNHIHAGIEPNKKTPGIEDNTYDVLCLNGVFCVGHITSDALPELARMVKPGGLIVFNVMTFQEKNYADDFGLDALSGKLESLVKGGLLRKWTTKREVYYGATGEEAQTYILHLT